MTVKTDKIHGFRIIRSVPIPELQCRLQELIHEKTGAQVMHISNDDPENLFCLGFRTHPNTSNGVAHILEHTVLCGSEKFDVKDPFFAMTRRSLNTYMNALTGSDFTCYPAASQIPKDFYNLLEVYLDAVFRPHLRRFSFLQEGHRLEFNKRGELEYRGVVFNEMKGAMGAPNSRLMELLDATLYPDITYGVNSGGNPKVIPELTYEGLVDFHKTYYDPSRCLFFFYGNMPLEGHLDFISKNVLTKASPSDPIVPIPAQKRFSAPKKVTGSYPAMEGDETIIAFGWLTCHILEQLDLLGLLILEIALLDTDASPLKMALLKSGMAKQVSSHLDPEMSEVPLAITLKGCAAANANKLETLIFETLKKGIPERLVEQALHQLEFHRSEISGGGAPFGLTLFFRAGLLKQHGGLPEDSLVIHSLFDALHEKREKEPEYFANLIQKYLIDNPHYVRVVMEPDLKLAEKEVAEEKKTLSEIQEKLKEAAARNIVNEAKGLADFQKERENENLDVLPKLHLSDVPKSSRDYPLKREKQGSVELFHHDCFTNGIAYAELVFPLPHLSREDLEWVGLFSSLMSQVGCGGRNYAENLEYIQAHTGGIWTTLSMNTQADDPSQFFPTFHVRGKALHRKVDKLFPLFYDLIASLDFTDRERMKELLLKQFTALHTSLNQHAMNYAASLSASALDLSSMIANLWSGLPNYWRVQELAENLETRIDGFIDTMQQLQDRLLMLEGAHLVLSCDGKMAEQLKNEHFYGLQEFETKSYTKWSPDYPLEPVEPQGRIITTPVAFTAKTFKTVPYVHAEAGALGVVGNLFDNLILHKRIREEGGAYGGGAINNSISGNFYFYAFRDPNISTTLDAFQEAQEHILAGKFTESDLEEAKLEMVQAMDAPIVPGSRANYAYTWLKEGKTLERRQAFRDRLLALSKEEVIAAVKEHIVDASQTGATVTFAGKELLEKENNHLSSPLPLHSI